LTEDACTVATPAADSGGSETPVHYYSALSPYTIIMQCDNALEWCLTADDSGGRFSAAA